MSAQVKINGVDKSVYVVPSTLNLMRALTSQIDTVNFDVIRKGGVAGGGYKPSVMDDIEIIENGTTIFGGQIIQIDEDVDGADVETFHISAKDYSFDMDRYLVVQRYENMTINDIIEDIKDTFLPAGYDTSNVNSAVIVKYAAFNYEYPSKVFQQLAELTNSDWYVDKDKKIYFFLKTALAAPFDLTDDNEKFYYNSLHIRDDIKNLRNSIIVRGGKYIGNLTSEKQIADGVTTKFLQAYQYDSVFVKLNGVSQTIGIDFHDDPTLFDVLYNFNEKSVSWPEGSEPADGDEVEVGGLPYIPLIVILKDVASIALYGEFQYKIIDSSINTKEGARDRARAEITAWANIVSDGSFETMEGGLEVGQKIRVQSTIRGIDQDYVISRISSTLINGLEFKHSITLMTTQTYGVIEFLQKLLIEKDKEIVISQDEVLQFITSFEDEMTFTDEINSITNTSGPYIYDDAGSIWNYATWG